MPVSSLLAFWAVAALLIAVPGPDWAFAINAGLRRQVLPAAAGIVLGYLVLTAATATGLGLLLTTAPAALTALTVAGALYLTWLGVRTLRSPSAPAAAEVVATPGQTLRQGAAVSTLNPKALLLFTALLPQFTVAGAAWPVPVQLAALGLVFTATCGLVYLGVAGAAHLVLRSRPAASRMISRAAGAAMVLIGVGLVLERVVSG